MSDVDRLSQAQQNPVAPEWSEIAIALEFATKYADELRYVAQLGKWLLWDGARWTEDLKLQVFTRSKRVCCAAANQVNKDNQRKKIASAASVAAIERLPRSDPRLATGVDDLDADPLILNTPAGVVDLRTGDMRPHRREDLCSKITAVGPGGSAYLWHEFLKRITNGDDELIAFLQRIVGYGLTGLTKEHALFFLYGTGANGKGVFINTLCAILAQYHETAAMETFTASKNDRHPTELARLRGARLVAAQETEQGRGWDESKIKTLTGGDRVAARFMRQDFFEYTPQFTLVVAGNHKPTIRNVDEAMRRRIHLVPFDVTIPPAERDLDLTEKLKAEWPGILQWAIEGCLQWQEIGLAPPERVRGATEKYLSSEDVLGQWIDECCMTGLDNTAPKAALWKSYKDYCDRAGEYAGTKRELTNKLHERGFEDTRLTGGVKALRGICPKPTETNGFDFKDQ